MDILQEYAIPLLPYYSTHISPYTSTLHAALTTLQGYSLPLINTLLSWAQDSPPWFSIGIFVVLLFLAIQVLNLLRRIVLFWTKLVFRLVFWGAVALVVAMVWQRGLLESAQDLAGWGQQVAEIWWGEYERWEGVGRGQQAGGEYSGGRHTGGERGNGRVRMQNARDGAGWR